MTARETFEKTMTTWCGKDRDLDSVIWTCVVSVENEAELIATIREARREHIREMERSWEEETERSNK